MINTLLFRAKYFIHYLFTAKGAHALHSPFVFKLYNEVILKSGKSLIPTIEEIRKELKRNHQLVDVIDIKKGKIDRKTISSIAKSSSSNPKFSSFLRLLINHLKVGKVLEAGTSLGINALYISNVDSIQKVATIEGSPIIANLALKVFQKNNSKKIELIQGNIYDVFESTIVKCSPEVIFLDADHRSQAISFYLATILTHAPSIKCIVIHDIYWSKDMLEKWNEIIGDHRFALTIDIFQAGLIFPSMEMPKQHFKLKF